MNALPGYWRHELGGALALAIEHYLNEPTISRSDLEYLRAYLVQWANADCWDENPHADEGDRKQLRELRLLARLIRSRADVGPLALLRARARNGPAMKKATMKPSTQSDLIDAGCSTPNCGHDHEVLYIHAACHPKAGVLAD
ncbi:MAG TPA: hypothetical protein VGF41_02310, partial [Myxococcaceae bacterium]